MEKVLKISKNAKISKISRNNLKGVVFTLEALITFLFFLIILFAFSFLINQKQNTVPLYEVTILNDIFQVLELKYHTDISTFMKFGLVSDSLADYLNYVKTATGHVVFLKFGNHKYYADGSIDCVPLISQKRLVVYVDLQGLDVNYFHELTIGLCS